MGRFTNEDPNGSANEGRSVEDEQDSARRELLRKEEARKLALEMLARDREAVELNVKVVPIL